MGQDIPESAREGATAIAVAEESNQPRMGTKDKLEEQCVNTIRFLAVDAVEKAHSGHPGTPKPCFRPMARSSQPRGRIQRSGSGALTRSMSDVEFINDLS